MKIFTDNQYKTNLQKQTQDIKDYYLGRIIVLEKQLEKAEDMKSIVSSLSNRRINITGGTNIVASSYATGHTLSLSDDVLVYVDDILGGKVIRQEAYKCIIIEQDGTIKTGLTKQKPATKYNYKLLIK